MKKTLSVILIIMLLMSLTGCGSETLTRNVVVEGSIFGGNAAESISEELRFNPDWLTKGDNSEYSGDLASFAALLSADSYFREKDLAKGTQNRVLIDGLNAEDYTWTTMLSNLGFTDVRHIESFQEKEYETDPNDSVTMNMGYMQSGDYDIYVVSIRGCFSSGEWVSAFDPGADTPEYVEMTGEHPEWPNKVNMKGLDVAASRAMQFVNTFMSEHEDARRKSCVLVTGHSRGGSLAQIVGAYLEKADVEKSFTYTFNSMPCTSDAGAEAYETIFNIVDDADFFGNLFSFSDELLYRYGTTLRGRGEVDAISPEQMMEYSYLFANHFKDRASLYEKKSYSSDFDTADPGCADEAAENLNSIISPETGLGLEGLISVSKSSDFSITVEYCDAAQIQCIGKVLTYGASAADAVKTLFVTDAEFCEIIDFITAHSAEISAGHLLMNTYALSRTFD